MKKIIVFTGLVFISFTGFSQSCFTALDQNMNGTLSKAEYSKLPRTNVDIGIKPSFASLDSDGDGKINRTEFVAVGICIWTGPGPGSGSGSGGSGGGSGDSNQEDDCFDVIDTDANGFISVEEYAVLAGLPDLPSFESFDSDPDGMISQNEFSYIDPEFLQPFCEEYGF